LPSSTAEDEPHDACLKTVPLTDVHNSELENTYVKIFITLKNRYLYLSSPYIDGSTSPENYGYHLIMP
jgi:hypothetical protein